MLTFLFFLDKRDKPNDQTPTLKEQIENIVQRIKDVTSSKGITLDEAIYMIKARCTQLQNEAKQQVLLIYSNQL